MTSMLPETVALGQALLDFALHLEHDLQAGEVANC
jgi:hypothetical protein